MPRLRIATVCRVLLQKSGSRYHDCPSTTTMAVAQFMDSQVANTVSLTNVFQHLIDEF